MKRVCVVDDEFRARRRVRSLIEQRQDFVLVGEADNGPDAVALIDLKQPDLVFLDVRMPGYSGFRVLREIQHRPAVIFVTAYDEYAVEAFEVHAVDYLLKPFPDNRFHEALDRATMAQISEKEIEVLRHLAEPRKDERKEAEPRSRRIDRIPGRRGSSYELLITDTVDCFVAENGLVFAHLEQRKVMVDFTLFELESRLDPIRFERVHRNTIANMEAVESVVRRGPGRIALRFGSGAEAQVSRDRTRKIKTRLGIE
jgi:two-component system LytT family response regulator